MESKYKTITLADLAVLMVNLEKAFLDYKIGHGDYNRTETEILKQLNTNVKIKKNLIESCLWAANMLDDTGDFWHPKKVPFLEFVRKMCVTNEAFNPYYNMFIESKRTFETYEEEEDSDE